VSRDPGERAWWSIAKEGEVDQIVERAGALDVHKEQVTACVRVPDGPSGRLELVETFSTTVGGLLVLADWLEAHRVEQVAMEATGVYWKPVWAVLEDRVECRLVNAHHVKQVPGRKTDVSDAQWLCRLVEAGLLRANLVPPKPIRTLRNLTRYRKTQIQDRQREANRLHKILEDTGIKLDCVATDILGKSGRAMLDALVQGTTNPEVLAELAKGRLRAKIPALREALEGRFDAQHALIVGQILAHLDFLDEAIERLSNEIEEQIRPFEQAVELLCTIPGVGRRTAEVIIAETGGDIVRFPERQTPRLMGRCVPRQRPIRRQAPPRKNPQRVEMAPWCAGRSRPRRRALEKHVSRRPIPTPMRPPRTQQSRHRGRPHDPRRHLAHAPDRGAIQRPRRRLLRPPGSRTSHPPTRRATRTARPQRHPPTPSTDGLTSLRFVFVSVRGSYRAVPRDAGRPPLSSSLSR
jgi:transposase